MIYTNQGFENRADAGRRLAARLEHLRGQDVVVVGLPRGGIPVGFEVARALGAPLDVLLVRKIGVPQQPELAMGAIAEGGIRVVNEDTIRLAQVDQAQFARVEAQELAELTRRGHRFRAGRPRIPLHGRTVIVVDDGIATGATARAACQALRVPGAGQVVLATPVVARDRIDQLRLDADEVIWVRAPETFAGVGEFYADFTQTSDEEVVDLLRQASGTVGLATDVEIAGRDGVRLPGRLVVPARPRGVVAFAHGSGSGRHSPRGRFVAETLTAAGLATLLLDLVTGTAEPDAPAAGTRSASATATSAPPSASVPADAAPTVATAAGSDLDLLAGRLAVADAWLADEPSTASLPLGYLGASTGAAVVLMAAGEPGSRARAIVSRGGRPDLAWSRLPAVHSPTLLIVGARDEQVLEFNRWAQQRLTGCVHRLEIVPGATHLFGEPGTLAQAAALARDWFLDALVPSAHASQ
ncbi:phosphoribosyltransferase family protein [Frankia sp. AiPa1]|uniref:phosphoribosyltransferase family protein n=1 Tax=Frankia sp. AiPa1 TaxID=573492 RepID=UPI00202AE0E3|nr:phosphoribosyltransferase family protein [Frankia sp. AiPa1]MCL9760101.1 phosphoribosyltransferase [Frankia sp. AiPa1]